MPYKAEHACRLLNPKQFEKKSGLCRRKSIAKNRVLIVCKRSPSDSMKTQAIRYPKNKWTADRARADCRQHHGKFHAAKSSLPPRGTGLKTGTAGPRRGGKPRTEAEREARHERLYG